MYYVPCFHVFECVLLLCYASKPKQYVSIYGLKRKVHLTAIDTWNLLSFITPYVSNETLNFNHETIDNSAKFQTPPNVVDFL